MGIEEEFAIIRAEEQERSYRHAAQELRKFLAGALCAECGEPLGNDDEIVQDDDDRTMHKSCEGGIPGRVAHT